MDSNLHSKLHIALQNALDAVGLLDFAQSLRAANTIEDSGFRKAIHRLTACEQMYESVGFIRQRFFRKENLALSFQALHADVQELHARLHSTDPAAEAVIAICAALKLYCRVREQLIHIHQFLASAERHDEASYQRLLEDTTKLEATFNPETGGCLLDPLLSLGMIVVLEVSCLKSLLSAETACERYNLKDAALQLFLANDCVSRLNKLLASGGGQNGGTYSRSEMHLFYSRLIASISDKSGVFFHHVLGRHISDHDDEPPGGLENLTAPAELLSHYLTQTKARSISLIYLIRPETPFSVDGYACSNGASNNPLTGLQSFPAICHIPTDRPPTEHWPNVVSLLQQELLTQIPTASEGEADAEELRAHNPAQPSPSSRPSSGGSGGGGDGGVGLSSLFASYLRPPLRQRIAAAGGSASLPSRPASPSLANPAAAAASRRPRGPTACFYDSKVNVTYVLALVVPRIVVCVVHAGRFDDKRNGQASAAFVARLARCLEHSDVLAGLKTKA
ncbi:hypothetical protein HDU87_002742 [Geranomyces variabilis]|uniref:Uncharacterized protein n=1 Tax=Geranomyces variabilis TaxID=109894 RepID=A0AAD5TS52_9FUNG|nr:hypothetical protein HDU87_002742 [Geranomyces variabilis]